MNVITEVIAYGYENGKTDRIPQLLEIYVTLMGAYYDDEYILYLLKSNRKFAFVTILKTRVKELSSYDNS